MEKQFVTYEIAMKLKEKGFNEHCLGYYSNDKELRSLSNPTSDFSTITSSEDCLASPLYQQVIDWFYDNHEILIVQIPSYSMKVWEVSKKGNKDVISGLSINKAIEEALKLITKK